jgi:sugar/nucleoside kinase (ribokinase family)
MALEKAALAAAITCKRKGAQPPTARELKELNAIH